MIKTCPECGCPMKCTDEKYGSTYNCPRCGYGIHETHEIPNSPKLFKYENRSK